MSVSSYQKKRMSVSSKNKGNNDSNNSNNEESNRPACAACKQQRKKCIKGCPFLLHFPANRHQEFALVHQIFGVANITKMIKNVDLAKQSEVVESIIWEAMVWMNKDHKEHGPYGLYKRLEKENEQLKEQLRKSQQELQPTTIPHDTPGTAFKSSWQGENCSDVRGLSRAENYSSYSFDYENLLLSSNVNSYRSLLEGYDKEAQGITSNGSYPNPPGLGFPGASPAPNLSFRQEQHMKDGRQERSRDNLAILPSSTRLPGNAMRPQSTRPGASGQARESQVRNMNISNYSSGPPTSHPTSLEEGQRVRAYYLYPPFQFPPPPTQNNVPKEDQF